MVQSLHFLLLFARVNIDGAIKVALRLLVGKLNCETRVMRYTGNKYLMCIIPATLCLRTHQNNVLRVSFLRFYDEKTYIRVA